MPGGLTDLAIMTIRAAQQRELSFIITFSSQTYQYRPEAAGHSLISEAMSTAAVAVPVADAGTLRRY
jgi:hypothetical protein